MVAGVMSHVRVQHFQVPFNVTNGVIGVVEQDSVEEVTQCVEAVLRTERYTREDQPEFGISDYTFTTPDVDLDEIDSAIDEWEPRARYDLESEFEEEEWTRRIIARMKGGTDE